MTQSYYSKSYFKIHLEDHFTSKTDHRECHKPNIHEKAVMAKHAITDTNAKRQKRWWEPQWEPLYPNGISLAQ